jgi:TolB-like protein/class 3 adenylate cyclase/Flp pilus assembly protein TadD
MNEERAKRKLSGILSADAVGYSRLMREDEVATVATLKGHREVMASLIDKYRGRVVDSPGDNILAEFGSVVDAVECAVEIQKELKKKNEGFPDNRRMDFRIGIHLGDVLEEEERIYGDGVNIAARIEGIAESGGICISRTTYDSVKDKLPFGYEYLGEHKVKHIPEPVRVYRVLIGPEAAGKVIGEKRKTMKWAAVAVVVILIVIAGSIVAWYFYLQKFSRTEPTALKGLAYPLPDKPSIVVLPFVNMSEDAKQEYFSDGIAEDLTTDLSKVSGLFIIASNSAFQYKGKAVDIKKISRELGVRYVLEGSVRRSEDKVRINAQLIDAINGWHLWAERYDGNIGDVFALQDKINRKIVAALAVKLTAGEQEHVARKDTANISAYDAFLQGWVHYVRTTPEDYVKAIRYFEKAVKLDPDYGRAYAALSSIYWESFYKFWHSSLGVSWRETKERADAYLEIAMKNPTPLAYLVAAKIDISSFEHENAITAAERAIALDPNDANSYLAMAYTLIYDGRPKEALGFIKKAMRLDPHYPAYNLFVLGLAHFGLENFEEAATYFERAIKRNPENYVALIPLAAAYAHLHREQVATATIEKLKKALPIVTVSFVKGCPLWRYKNPADRSRLLDGLNKTALSKSLYETLRKEAQSQNK